MARRLEGKRAIVTGAASGIGRACALELARGGASVVAVDIAEDGLREAARAFEEASGARVETFKAEVSDYEEAGRIVAAARERLGGVDVLVTCAGVTADAPLWKMDEAAWDKVLGVNLKGTFNYVRAVSTVMRERRAGKIVTVASVEAFRGRFGLANYAASKAGLVALTRSAAAELGRHGVCVNAVSPGFIRTPLVERLPEAIRERAARESVLGRMGEPEDVAHAVLFLCSERARHVTGAVLNVDGGQSL